MNRYTPILQQYCTANSFDLSSLVESGGRLTIELKQPEAAISLAFDSYLAYRRLDEGDAMLMLRWVAESSALGRTYYEVADSEFIDWYISQSYGVRKASDVRHFAILTSDDVIDVLALSEPAVARLHLR